MSNVMPRHLQVESLGLPQADRFQNETDTVLATTWIRQYLVLNL